MVRVGDRDEEQLRQAEEAALRAASENEQLAVAAMGLLRCRSREDVYDVIGDFMVRSVPGSIIIVNEAAPETDTFITRKVAGLDSSSLAAAAKFLGFEIIGRRSAIPPALRERLLSGILSKIHGGIAELASIEMPHAIALAGAKMFGIRDVYTIGIADLDNTLGNFHILTRTPDAVVSPHIIESFAHHCFSALSGIIATRELVDVSERNALLVSSMVEGLGLHEIILDEHGTPCDYRFLDVNPALEAMMGLKAEDIVGRTRLEVRPDTDHALIARYGTVATTGAPCRFDKYIADVGRYFAVVAYCPKPGQFATALSDITERKQAERELAFKNAILSAQMETSMDGILIVDECARILSYNRRFADMWRIPSRLVEDGIDEPVLQFVANQMADQESFVRRVRYFYEHRDKVCEDELILADGRVFERHSSPMIGDDEHYYGRVWYFRDITGRRRAANALRERNAFVETLLENAPIGFAVNTIDDGQGIFVSRRFEEIYGVAPNSLGSVDDYFENVFLDPVHREKMRDRMIADMATGDAARMKWDNVPITTRAGERKTITAVNIPVLEQNLMISTVQDVTERDQAQHDLRDSEDRYRSVVNESPDGIMIMDGDGLVTMASPAAVAMFGCQREEELLGRSTVDLIVAEDRAGAQAHLAMASEGAVAGVREGRGLRVDGSTFEAEVRFGPIREREGEPTSMVAVIRDVTERRRLQEARLVSESRFKAMFENAPSGIALIDSLTGRIEDANLMYARIMGRTIEELRELDWMSITHPDDVQAALDAEQILYAGQSGRYQAEKRYIRPDGSVVWASITEASVQIGDEAHPKYIAMVEDITRDMEIEELLDRQREHIDRTLTSVIDIAGTIGDIRDPYTAGHQRRVAQISVRVAQDLGMTDAEVADIKVAALLHDVGKVTVPAEILSKPGAISPAELSIIQSHAEAGFRIVTSAHMVGSIPEMIYQHHERLDGSGYPRGLASEQILMGARVIAVADVVEAMSSHRPYRPAIGIEAALAEIEQGAGRIYDRDVVSACIALFRVGQFELPA